MRKLAVQSTDQSHTLNVVTWTPDQPPIAIVQILTGMAEYIERYDGLAQFLVSQQIAVIGHDYVGQGHSVQSAAELGYFGPNALTTLLDDCTLIGQLAHTQAPDCPLIVLGHSMGSMLATQYLKQTTNQIAGILLMGVIAVPSYLKLALPLVNTIAKIAPRRQGTLWHHLAFSVYPKRFDRHRPFSWLSYNLANVTAYEQHPLCGYVFSNNGFATLFTLSELSRQTDWLTRLKDRPILILSGQDDPAGGYGQRATQLQHQFKKHTITHATVCILPKTAHEILQETAAVESYQLIHQWLLTVISEFPSKHHNAH